MHRRTANHTINMILNETYEPLGKPQVRGWHDITRYPNARRVPGLACYSGGGERRLSPMRSRSATASPQKMGP